MGKRMVLVAAVVAASVGISTTVRTPPVAARQPAATGPATTTMALPPPPVAAVQEYLDRGDTAAAAAAMADRLKAVPGDDQARFSLGVVQFLRAVEHLSQAGYTYGFNAEKGREFLPVAVPIPVNPNPKAIRYDDLRAMAGRFVDDLAEAETTLAAVKDPDVKLPVRIGRVELDLTGTGVGLPRERVPLWKVFAAVWPGANADEAAARDFVICLDQGDVQWLRGYCHLLCALSDVMLAYDEHEMFDRTAHLLFRNVDSPYAALAAGENRERWYDFPDIADAVAAVHLMRFPLKEPLRLLQVRSHLKAMAACSRRSWQLIEAETDDDHEWLPNPRQHSVIPRVRVTREMIDGWMKFLDQLDLILDGKALIPFWRGDGTKGVNLAKLFFTDPQPFDLILWVQGSGVLPAVEDGPLVDKSVYTNLERVFEGSPFAFGAWFN